MSARAPARCASACRRPARTSGPRSTAPGLALTLHDVAGVLRRRRPASRWVRPAWARGRCPPTSRTWSSAPSAPPATSSAGRRRVCAWSRTTASRRGGGWAPPRRPSSPGSMGAWALCPDVEAIDRRRGAPAGHRDRGAPRQRRGLPARRGDAVLDGRRRRPRRPARRRSATSLPVVLVPDATLSTHVARGLLPELVPHADAAFNAGRSALLVHALTADPACCSRPPRTGCTSASGRRDARLARAGRPAARGRARRRGVRRGAQRAGAHPPAPEDRDDRTAVRVREIRSSPRRVAAPRRSRSTRPGRRCWPGAQVSSR